MFCIRNKDVKTKEQLVLLLVAKCATLTSCARGGMGKMLVCEVRVHRFEARQCAPSEWHDQLHRLGLANKER